MILYLNNSIYQVFIKKEKRGGWDESEILIMWQKCQRGMRGHVPRILRQSNSSKVVFSLYK